jgi:hypothetical protein
MKRYGFNLILLLAAMLVMGWLTQVGAQAEPQAGAMTHNNTMGEHPVGSMVSHIICLSLIVGAGASIVTALFRSPYRQ